MMSSSVSRPFFFLTFSFVSLLAVSNCLLLVESLLSSNEVTKPTAEDKFRLGSMPPSCHNRCRLCSPCTAVQVPTLPPSKKVLTTSGGGAVASSSSAAAAAALGGQYSNYKPLGWKCRCGNRLYDP